MYLLNEKLEQRKMPPPHHPPTPHYQGFNQLPPSNIL